MIRLLASASLVISLLLPSVAAAGTPPPVEDFFDNPSFDGAVLSPDARKVAVRAANAGKRQFLAVIDLKDMKVLPLAQFKDVDVGHIQWVNNERLIFHTADRLEGEGRRRTFTVKSDGTEYRQVYVRDNPHLAGQMGLQDSEEVYLQRALWDDSDNELSFLLMRLNVKSGSYSTVPKPPSLIRRFVFDEKGQPRMAVGQDRGMINIFLRNSEGEWDKLASHAAYTTAPGQFVPVGFAGPDRLLVQAYVDGETTALHEYDLANKKLGAPIVQLKGFDFDGSLVYQNGKLLGVNYLADARGTVWLDPHMQKVQAEVDARMPGTVNLISVAARPETPWVLVRSYADVLPSVYMLYNYETKVIEKVVETRPRIKPQQMGRQQLVRYKARDGMEIPAWLTLPAGGGKGLPLIVLVHGGPFVRGAEWEWDAEVQFLASRGYAVLQPEFRGSDGFGQKHLTAGFKQWGLKMQDDLADGARWAIAQGFADPARICIAGASYGGYATLMGLINDPGLYKCGVAWAAVTDIELMYTGTWRSDSDLSTDFRKFGMPRMIGDRIADAAQFKATSPLHQAARVKLPLLLAHGEYDERVPIFHGKKFLDAVKPHNKQVEWVEYYEEGHGWYKPQTRVAWWTRVEKFLNQHIGKQ